MVMAPARNDIRWLKMFLDDTAKDVNQRTGERLATLLTTINAKTPGILNPAELANRITATFGTVLKVATVEGVLPPP